MAARLVQRCTSSILIRHPAFVRGIVVTAAVCIKKPVFNGELPPKRPGSAYSLFLKDHFHLKDTESTGVDEYGRSWAVSRMKELSTEWAVMSAEQKKPYYDLFEQLKERYLADKKAFLGSMSKEEFKEYKFKRTMYFNKTRKFREILRQKREGTYDPVPRAVTGLNIYMKEQLNQQLITSLEDRKQKFSQIALQWNNLSHKEKELYINKARQISDERLANYCIRHPEYKAVLAGKEAKKNQVKTTL